MKDRHRLLVPFMLFFLLLLAAAGCGRAPEGIAPVQEGPTSASPGGQAQQSSSQSELAGKKIVIAVAPKDFRDEELFVPERLFREKGAVVTVASTREGTAVGMLGGTVKVEATFAELRAAGYDAVVIAGGIGSQTHLWGNAELQRLVREAYDQGKVVAAICLSPAVLARAGCLEGREATVFPDPAAVKELKAGGAKYVNRSVVVSGKVVTGRDPEAAGEFAQAVARLLAGR